LRKEKKQSIELNRSSEEDLNGGGDDEMSMEFFCSKLHALPRDRINAFESDLETGSKSWKPTARDLTKVGSN
jgi:hypothetical protein